MKQIFAKIELDGKTIYATDGNDGKYTIDGVEVDVIGGMDVSGISIVADPSAYFQTNTMNLKFQEVYPLNYWRTIAATYVLINKQITIMTSRSGVILTTNPELILKITGHGMDNGFFILELSTMQNTWLPGKICKTVYQEEYQDLDIQANGNSIAFGIGNYLTTDFPTIADPPAINIGYLIANNPGAYQFILFHTIDDSSAAQGANAVYDEEGNLLTGTITRDPFFDPVAAVDVVRVLWTSASFTKTEVYFFPKYSSDPLPDTLTLIDRVIRFATNRILISTTSDAAVEFKRMCKVRGFDNANGESQLKFTFQENETVADFLSAVCNTMRAMWRINNEGMIEFVISDPGSVVPKFYFQESDVVSFESNKVSSDHLNNVATNEFKYSPAHRRAITKKTYKTSSRDKSIELYGNISPGKPEHLFRCVDTDKQAYDCDKYHSFDNLFPSVYVKFVILNSEIPDSIRFQPWDFVQMKHKDDITAGSKDRMYWIMRVEPNYVEGTTIIDAMDVTEMNTVDPYLRLLISPIGPKYNGAVYNDAITNSYGITNTNLVYDNTVSGKISSPLKVNATNGHLLFTENSTLCDLKALDKMTWHMRVKMASLAANQNFIVWSSTGDYTDYITLRFLTATKCLDIAFVQNGTAFYNKSSATNSINDTTSWHDIGVYFKKGTELDANAYEVHLLLDGTEFLGAFTPPQNISDGILTIGTRRTGASTYTASLATNSVFEEIMVSNGGTPIAITNGTYTVQTEPNTIFGYNGAWPII